MFLKRFQAILIVSVCAASLIVTPANAAPSLSLPFASLEDAQSLVQAALSTPTAVCESAAAGCMMRDGENVVGVSVSESLDQVDLFCVLEKDSPGRKTFTTACLHAELALGMSFEYATTCAQTHQDNRRIGDLDFECSLLPAPDILAITVKVVPHVD
ncbi:hypothetical protein LAZ40_04610 [Cereibacter sphaeroides]|uniref:hypothetical protein n=1 Tax=Cereibacter sphaeroides TaxID=1063 RepID=UPI001F22DF5C|nr:hypothetical protein [Cereibacter sphaeroides]MCE6958337.1 hypothetical protein [Cereibacter sphaeroides]MCE6972204.1 hypothetical protein [Cereibacter sphaeroides]